MAVSSATSGSGQRARKRTSGPRLPLPSDYMPRRPAKTVLYAFVRDHLEAFLAYARESYDRGLPRYVEQAFRSRRIRVQGQRFGGSLNLNLYFRTRRRGPDLLPCA